MRAANTVSAISDKLRDTAHDATEHLAAAGEAVNQGLRDTVDVATKSARNSAKSAEAAVQDAAVSGKELYSDTMTRASNSIAGIDKFVSRNLAGTLLAALGMGLVLGLMARK